MSRVTSKLQVTLPKAIAGRYGIRPGDEIEWLPAGDGIRVTLARESSASPDRAERLALFDAATARQRRREAGAKKKSPPRSKDRGWTREELYERGRAR
jgi:AbrB family looped-hinge helix DNA binding protein